MCPVYIILGLLFTKPWGAYLLNLRDPVYFTFGARRLNLWDPVYEEKRLFQIVFTKPLSTCPLNLRMIVYLTVGHNHLNYVHLTFGLLFTHFMGIRLLILIPYLRMFLLVSGFPGNQTLFTELPDHIYLTLELLFTETSSDCSLNLWDPVHLTFGTCLLNPSGQCLQRGAIGFPGVY